MALPGIDGNCNWAFCTFFVIGLPVPIAVRYRGGIQQQGTQCGRDATFQHDLLPNTYQGPNRLIHNGFLAKARRGVSTNVTATIHTSTIPNTNILVAHC